jgi:hypothetical protein
MIPLSEIHIRRESSLTIYGNKKRKFDEGRFDEENLEGKGRKGEGKKGRKKKREEERKWKREGEDEKKG